MNEDARKLYLALKSLDLRRAEGPEGFIDAAREAILLLDEMKDRDWQKPQKVAPSRTVACARMALEGAALELEESSFSGGATYAIRDDAGVAEAMACVAVGWRAEWLSNIMQLLTEAAEQAVEDKKKAKQRLMEEAVESIRTKKPGEDR